MCYYYRGPGHHENICFKKAIDEQTGSKSCSPVMTSSTGTGVRFKGDTVAAFFSKSTLEEIKEEKEINDEDDIENAKNQIL